MDVFLTHNFYIQNGKKLKFKFIITKNSFDEFVDIYGLKGLKSMKHTVKEEKQN
jgi:hypothetical protein